MRFMRILFWINFIINWQLLNAKDRCKYFKSLDLPEVTLPDREVTSGVGKIFTALHGSSSSKGGDIIQKPNNSTKCYEWKCKSKRMSNKNCKYCLPSVFVAGFSKCGTTALCSKLTLHPEIKPYRKKEINIFTKYFDEFSWETFEKRVLDTEPQKIGNVYLDCTASVFRDFNAIVYLKKFSPMTKFIFVVRDPFQRLASWLLMFKRALPSQKYERFYRVWMSALRKSQYEDYERFDSSVIHRLMTKERYISSFLYAEILLHWLAGIPKNRILLLDHYDLEEHPLEVMRRIESFLSLSPHNYDLSELLSVSINTGTLPEDDDGHLSSLEKNIERGGGGGGGGGDHKRRLLWDSRKSENSSSLLLLPSEKGNSHERLMVNITRNQPIHAPYQITDKRLLSLSRHLFWPSLCLFERMFGWSIHISTESEL